MGTIARNGTLLLIPAREATLPPPGHPDQHRSGEAAKKQGAVPRTGCWSTSQATEQWAGPPSQVLVLLPLAETIPGPSHCLSLAEDAVNASCVYTGHVQL